MIKKNQKGAFITKTLLPNLFIAAILLLISVPSGMDDSYRARKLAEPIQALDALKIGIADYYQSHQSFKPANGAVEIKNTYGISVVEELGRWSYTVANNGVITATAGADVGYGFNGGWIRIAPNVNPDASTITWTPTIDGTKIIPADMEKFKELESLIKRRTYAFYISIALIVGVPVFYIYYIIQFYS